MKIRRFLYLMSIFAVVALAGNFLASGSDSRNYSENYPDLVCPTVGSGTNSQISFTSSTKPVRFLPSKSYNLKAVKTTRLIAQQSSVVIDGAGITSLNWISKAGIWAGGATCLSSQTAQYFVGGTGDISGKGKIYFLNSGLSSSIVDLDIYSESKAIKKTITVPKNQIASLALVSLAPGSKTLAIKVTPRTGRVTSYLIDERVKGLSKLGGDVVNSQSALDSTLIIPAIPHSDKSSKTHVLRILNPNLANANISAEVISADGRYVPVSMDNRKISNGKVVDIAFNFDSKLTAFALKITSDQPIAASVYSKVSSDFVWSTAVAPAIQGTWAITGLDPTLNLTGSDIRATLKISISGKKSITKKLNGSDFLSYKLPKGAVGLQIVKLGADNAAGLIITSQSGIGFFPLVNGSTLTRSTVPTANIGVLNP